MRGALTLFAAVCGWLGGLGAAQAEARFALIVGHALGDAREVPLRWAEEDARRMRQVLIEVGDVQPARATMLLSPTREALEAAYIGLQARIAAARDRGEQTLLFFYYSGHADAQALHLGEATVDTEALIDTLSTGPAATTVAIIDACQNDRAPRSRQKGARRAPGFAWPALKPARPTGLVVLRSAARGEVAQESDDLQGSLFSHHLFSGMRGSADANDDGVVTLSELYAHGYRETLSDTHQRALAVQHGQARIELEGQGALVISTPRRSSGWLGFADDVAGHALIIDDHNGRIIAEVLARPSVRVAVPPGRYRVQLRDADAFSTALIDVTAAGRRLKRQELKRQAMLAVAQKGRAHDAYPWRIAAGPSLARSYVPGFESAIGVDAQLSYQVTHHLRIGGGVRAAYASAGAAPVQLDRQQLELATLVGVDLVWPLTSTVNLLVQPRLGGAWVQQSAEARDRERLTRVGLSAPTQSQTVFGPQAAAGVALEYFAFSRFGVRLDGAAGLAWLSVDGALEARPVGSGTLSLVFRL